MKKVMPLAMSLIVGAGVPLLTAALFAQSPAASHEAVARAPLEVRPTERIEVVARRSAVEAVALSGDTAPVRSN